MRRTNYTGDIGIIDYGLSEVKKICLKEHDIKIVFVSPQFSQKSAKTISQNINAKVATIDPMVSNWSEGLMLTAKEIASSYSK